MSLPVTALVLAGTRPGGDPLARQMGVSHKGLVELEGTPIVARVITALKEAGVERIAVSCDDEAVSQIAQDAGALILRPDTGPSGSVMRAFDRLGTPLLVTTSDHGLLKPAWVQQCVRDMPDNADVGVMLARRERVEAALPGGKRTYLNFSDGGWSGCNLFCLGSERARRAIEAWSQIEADRKRPWRLVARLGLGTLLSYMLGRLTMAQGIERLGARLGVKAALIDAADGMAAVDIDKVEDVELARAWLAGEFTT